jgi:putative hydrolase
MSESPDESPFNGLPFFGDLARAMAGQGPLQWDVARQVALMTATGGTNTEANVDPAARVALERLLPIADMHVRNATGFVASATPTPPLIAVNRSQWTHHTLEAYKPLFTHLATSLGAVDATASDDPDTPDDGMTAMLGALNKMMAPAMMGMSIGTMVGQLALRAFGQYDLPVPRPGTPQLLCVAPNIDAFANDWSIAADDMRMWVLVHELANHAVYEVAHVRTAISDALSRYVASFRPNPQALMERLTTVDMGDTDPMTMMQKFLTDPAILLGAVRSSDQEAQAPVLDALIAAIIGTVDHVVDTVSAGLLGGGSRIAEAVRRRRVEATPQDTFVEQLLGLKLSGDQVRRGNEFVAGVIERAGEDGLARMFVRPGNLPTPNELDAPGLWLARTDYD